MSGREVSRRRPAPRADIEAIRDAGLCGRPGCDCTRPKGNVHCPTHLDATPSLTVHEAADGKVLVHCKAGCEQMEVIEALRRDGLWPESRQVSEAWRGGRGTRSAVVSKHPYELRDAYGRHVATHVRQEHADRTKSFVWLRPDGRSGLGGTRAADLPLYGAERLPSAAADAMVVLVEGEKAAESLLARDVLALGTVTGAGGTPADEVLCPLLGSPVLLWPDADERGREHMQRIAGRLRALGHNDVRRVNWPEAPEHGDAADFEGNDEALHALLAAAEDCQGEGRLPSATVGSLRRSWQPSHPRRAAKIVRLSEVQPEPVAWLWRGRIPLGKLSLLDGDPGQLKSTIALDLAARVTTGRAMPDGTLGLDGGAVLMSYEDGLADTIRPRLDAAGADCSRVVVLQGVGAGDDERLPAIPDDLEALREAIAQVDAKLVIIDPLMAALSGDVNSHRDQDVRRALAPLTRLVEECGVAVLVVRHLRKSAADRAIYRGGGSIGIAGAARSVLLAAADPDREGEHILAVVKSNLAALAASLRYRPVNAADAVAVDWLGTSEHGADALLAAVADGEKRSSLDEACEVLRQILAAGAVPSGAVDGPAPGSVRAQAREAGVADRTLLRAKDKLGVEAQKGGFAEGWCWALPDDDGRRLPTEAEDGQSETLAALDDPGSLEVEASSGAVADVVVVELPMGRPAGTCADCGRPTSESIGMCARCEAREIRFHRLGQPMVKAAARGR